MPKVRASARFIKAFRKLPPEVQARVVKALTLLAQYPRHPSLQARPIQGTLGVYEARVDKNHRLTYERLPGDVLQMRVAGRHAETLKNP